MNSKDELHDALDDLSSRGDWGLWEADRWLPLLPIAEFAIPRIETLVAGFSNACHLKCPFCYEEHYGRMPTKFQELDVDKLIRLIRQHREEAGGNLEYFRIGNTGEPLIHRDLKRLVTDTEDCVNWFSVISSLSVKDRGILEFLGEHAKINMIHVSCDAGDPETYRRLRVNGDFEVVWSNIARLKQAGKYIVLNVVVLCENQDSILDLPKRMAAFGIDELHLFYPLNTNRFLNHVGLHKLSLYEFREFFLRMREKCEKGGILFRTDPWVFHPAMVGVIPDIDTPEQYEEYTRMPCDWLWLLILHPDGTFHNCSVLNTLGSELSVEMRPFPRCRSLLELANAAETLSFRKLQLCGQFPLPCRRICHKRPTLRRESDARFLFRLRYGSSHPLLSAEEFVGHLTTVQSKFLVRAFSANVRKFLVRFPALAQHVEWVVDRNEAIDCEFPVVSPTRFERSGERRIVLLGSNRSSVFQHIAEQASKFSEIYTLVVVGSDPKDFRIQRML